VVQLASTSERSGLRTAFDVQGWRTIAVDADGTLVSGGDQVSADDRQHLSARVVALVDDARTTELTSPLVPTDPEEIALSSGRHAAFLVPSSIPPHLLFLRALDSGSHDTGDTAPLVSLGLTIRESEVAAQLTTGATNRQIADTLGISVGTVKKHLQKVFAAMGVETRAAAATRVMRLLD
jgi:DNA-binding NarL/FixJ family response regulator